MCTVSYLPLGKGEFILTSNRDEKITRPAALAPQKIRIKDQQLLFPKDPQHGGTWIACSENGKVICLLNGAFEKHHYSPPYAKSRGLVVLDAFQFHNAEDFVLRYDLSGVEPFTMIFIQHKILHELRWDGVKTWIKKPSPEEPHIWASATLYTQETIQKRKIWFSEWLQNTHAIDTQKIQEFHRVAGEGDLENDLSINRGNYMITVSITSILQKQSTYEMLHQDLTTHSTSLVQMERSGKITLK